MNDRTNLLLDELGLAGWERFMAEYRQAAAATGYSPHRLRSLAGLMAHAKTLQGDPLARVWTSVADEMNTLIEMAEAIAISGGDTGLE